MINYWPYRNAMYTQNEIEVDQFNIRQKCREEFLTKLDDFHDVFRLRDEIGTCPFIEVHLKLKDETPFFVRPYSMWEDKKESYTKRNG